jgi:hypothetical protein
MKTATNAMPEPAIFDYCIYTIRHSDDLAHAAAAGGRAEYEEHTAWVTGLELFQQAQRSQTRMPVLFGAAERASGIIYRGFLESVSVTEPEPGMALTRYVVTQLKPVSGEPAKSTLVLRSSGGPLSDQYIRPYAICVTPDFVKAEA